MSNEMSLQLRPNPGPEELPPEPSWILIALAIALLCAAGAVSWYAVRWWRNRKQAARPAHEAALAQLEQLAGMKFGDPASADRFYVLVTGILRRYVADRFQIEAAGRTTRELTQAITGLSALTDSQKSSVAGLLARADLVKFAKDCPPGPETEEFVREVRQFIQETALISIPRPRP
jgi:hypothetical protein